MIIPRQRNAITLTLRHQPDTFTGDEFWYVHDETDRVVGRIFRSVRTNHLGPESWFWGLKHPHQSGSTEPHYGHAPSRDDAMAAFAKRWLLSHAPVEPGGPQIGADPTTVKRG